MNFTYGPRFTITGTTCFRLWEAAMLPRREKLDNFQAGVREREVRALDASRRELIAAQWYGLPTEGTRMDHPCTSLEVFISGYARPLIDLDPGSRAAARIRKAWERLSEEQRKPDKEYSQERESMLLRRLAGVIARIIERPETEGGAYVAWVEDALKGWKEWPNE